MQNEKISSENKETFYQRSYLRPLFFEIRCPECNKLYRVDSRDMISLNPHFDCLQCGVTFNVSQDPLSSGKLVTRTDRKQVYSKLCSNKLGSEAIRKCPKCGLSNLKNSSECYKCGVIFDKYEKVLAESNGVVGGQVVLPSLVKAWQDLMSDYSNITKHAAFVGQCEDLQAIPFALKKYQDLKEVQPQDTVASEMHQKLVFKIISKVKKAQSYQKLNQSRYFVYGAKLFYFLNSRPWFRYFRILSWLVPFICVFWGFYQPQLSNMVGLGVSLAFLRVTIAMILKGSFNFENILNF